LATNWEDQQSIKKNWPLYKDRTKYGSLQPPPYMLSLYKEYVCKARAVIQWRRYNTQNQQKALKKEYSRMAAENRASIKEQEKARKKLEREAKKAAAAEEAAQKKHDAPSAEERREANGKRRNIKKREKRAEVKAVSLLLAVVIHMLWIVIPHADHCYSCASLPNIISRKPPCTASSWEMKRRPPSPSLSRRSRKRRRRVKSALSILIPPRPAISLPSIQQNQRNGKLQREAVRGRYCRRSKQRRSNCQR